MNQELERLKAFVTKAITKADEQGYELSQLQAGAMARVMRSRGNDYIPSAVFPILDNVAEKLNINFEF